MKAKPFHGPRDYLDAARDPEATPDDLRMLASSEYDFVRLAVAEHTATPPDVLSDLVPPSARTWNEQVICLRLAGNRLTPAEALRRISDLIPEVLHDRDATQGFAAGVALFQREDAPADALLALLDDPRATTEFRKVVARETSRGDIRDHLRHDRSERVRRAAVRRA